MRSHTASQAAGKKNSPTCEQIYARLCKGFKRGPEMVGACNRARPSVGDKIPDKCTADFQSKVEGYEDVKH